MSWSGWWTNSRRSRPRQDPGQALPTEVSLLRKPDRHGVSALRSWAAWANRAPPQTRDPPQGRRAASSSHLHLSKHPHLSLEPRILRASAPLWPTGPSLLKAGGHAVGEAFLDRRLDLRDAVLRVGVGAEELDGAAARYRLQHLHDVDHRARVVAGLGHEPDPEAVRLRFVLSAEAQVHELHDGGGYRLALCAAAGVARVVAGDDGSAAQALGQLGLCQVLGAVARDDVPGFVAEHAGVLPRRVELRRQRLGHEDLAARQREGVHRLRIC